MGFFGAIAKKASGIASGLAKAVGIGNGNGNGHEPKPVRRDSTKYVMPISDSSKRKISDTEWQRNSHPDKHKGYTRYQPKENKNQQYAPPLDDFSEDPQDKLIQEQKEARRKKEYIEWQSRAQKVIPREDEYYVRLDKTREKLSAAYSEVNDILTGKCEHGVHKILAVAGELDAFRKDIDALLWGADRYVTDKEERASLKKELVTLETYANFAKSELLNLQKEVNLVNRQCEMVLQEKPTYFNQYLEISNHLSNQFGSVKEYRMSNDSLEKRMKDYLSKIKDDKNIMEPYGPVTEYGTIHSDALPSIGISTLVLQAEPKIKPRKSDYGLKGEEGPLFIHSGSS